MTLPIRIVVAYPRSHFLSANPNDHLRDAAPVREHYTTSYLV